ncbi:hypothetical protein [Natrononativus amylolyticus]|uniref:hypothetical protein n=1 Tax=Natrononativus amylolyticus TaxID=2963434 RepID=UPI0020CF5CC3|nr:hypothetical protein [Natrononativus amylolyticus]
MFELTRRQVVAAAGAVSAGAVAGCLDDGDDAANETDAGQGLSADVIPEDGTTLGEIAVENLDGEDHTIDVLVEYDGEIEHWSTHDLEAGGEGASLEQSWPDEPGTFRVTARLDGEEFEQVSPAKWNDPSCLNLLVLVGRDGEIRTTGDTDGGPCDALEETASDGEE